MKRNISTGSLLAMSIYITNFCIYEHEILFKSELVYRYSIYLKYKIRM